MRCFLQHSFQNTGGTCRWYCCAASRAAHKEHLGGNAMSSKIALRVATLAIGTAAFAAVPALAASKSNKSSVPDQTPHYQAVTKWDHGKKYTDYIPEGQSGSMSR